MFNVQAQQMKPVWQVLVLLRLRACSRETRLDFGRAQISYRQSGKISSFLNVLAGGNRTENENKDKMRMRD